MVHAPCHSIKHISKKYKLIAVTACLMFKELEKILKKKHRRYIKTLTVVQSDLVQCSLNCLKTSLVFSMRMGQIFKWGYSGGFSFPCNIYFTLLGFHNATNGQLQ